MGLGWKNGKHRLTRLFEMGDIDEKTYIAKKDEIARALDILNGQEAPSQERAKTTLTCVVDFPWLQASTDKQAATFQSSGGGILRFACR